MRLIDGDALEERLADKNNGCAGECECCEHYLREKWEKGWCGLIANAPTVGGWISVKDKLPKEQGVYLVAFKPPFPKVTIAWWATREYGWYDLEYNFNTDGVSHWMPLPPMPEQEVSRDE